MRFTRLSSNGLYKPAHGIYADLNLRQIRAYSAGDLLASEYARNDAEYKEKLAAIRQVFSGLPCYEQ